MALSQWIFVGLVLTVLGVFLAWQWREGRRARRAAAVRVTAEDAAVDAELAAILDDADRPGER